MSGPSLQALCGSYLQSGAPATRGQSRPVHRLPAPQRLGEIHPTLPLSATPALGLVVTFSSGPLCPFCMMRSSGVGLAQGFSKCGSHGLCVHMLIHQVAPLFLSILLGTNRNFNSGQWLTTAFEDDSLEINIFQR